MLPHQPLVSGTVICRVVSTFDIPVDLALIMKVVKTLEEFSHEDRNVGLIEGCGFQLGTSISDRAGLGWMRPPHTKS